MSNQETLLREFFIYIPDSKPLQKSAECEETVRMGLPSGLNGWEQVVLTEKLVVYTHSLPEEQSPVVG